MKGHRIDRRHPFKETTMQSPNEIRQQITAQIVPALKNGNLPPW
jgi:hypothetical protein